METPPPEVMALIVADHIYRDDTSGKVFILGSRTWIGARSFPLEHPQLAVYVALINGRGTVDISIQVIDNDEEREPISQGEAQVTFPSPLSEVEVVFELNEVVFPEPGEYRVQLRSDGRFLRERTLVVLRLGSNGEED